MKTFSISMISLVAMTGLAFAQAKTGTTTTTTTTAGSGATAGAGAKVDAKAGGVTAGAKVDAKGGAAMPVAAPPAPPKPPVEIAAAVKAMGRAKTCKGSGMGPDMQMADMKGTVAHKADLDGWFIRQNINMTVGKGKAAYKMKMESFMTWDAKASKWRVMGVSNDGGTMMGTADMKDGKYEFTGEMTSGMGTVAFKDHGDMTDPKAVKMWGEMSMDKGKTWMKVYEQTCK